MEEVSTLKMYAIRQCIKTLTDDELKKIRMFSKRLAMKRQGRRLYGPLLAKTLKLGQFMDELSSFNYVGQTFLVGGQRYHLQSRRGRVLDFVSIWRSRRKTREVGEIWRNLESRVIKFKGALPQRLLDFGIFLLDTPFCQQLK
jgi:hypothetical protein